MNDFSFDLTKIELDRPIIDEISYARLKKAYKDIKTSLANGHEMTLEEQKVILEWRRIDREKKFVLNKEKETKPLKEPKVKKPKKLSQKALGLLLLRQLQGEALTADEERNLHFTKTGEIL